MHVPFPSARFATFKTAFKLQLGERQVLLRLVYRSLIRHLNKAILLAVGITPVVGAQQHAACAAVAALQIGGHIYDAVIPQQRGRSRAVWRRDKKIKKGFAKYIRAAGP